MTAVEWLIEKLTDEPEHYLFLCDKPEYMYGLTKIIQQAIEMEKQHIIDAYDAGYKDGNAIPGYDYFDNSESYYEKTFKK